MTQQYILPVSDVKAGDTLIPDDGFTCVPVGEPRIVHQDAWYLRYAPAFVLAWFGLKPSDKGPGSLYVNCAHGRHYLDGQLDDDGTNLVGFIKAEVPATEEEEFGNEDYELVGYDAELTEDIEAYKAGDNFTIMSLEGTKYRLMDDEGRVVLAERSKFKVVDGW